MKPIRLVMTAFGPYDNATVIDFRQFDQQKLFLITGKTGSGKTTIFDAITYALYGESSGGSRMPDTFRCQNSPDERKTSVVFEFEYKGKSYKIERCPAYSYHKKIGRKTKELGQVALYLPNGDVDEGEKTVNTTVRNLLGIDCAQFRQIVMLAQGQFEKLLHANSNEREVIFRKIFDTTQYSAFQNQLRERTNALKTESETKLTTYNRDLERIKLAEPEELISVSEQLREIIAHPTPDLCQDCISLLHTFIEIDNKLEGEAGKESKQLQDGILSATEEKTKAEYDNDLIKERFKAQETFDKLELQKDSIEEIKAEIELARKAQSIVSIELSANTAAGNKKQAEDDIRENQSIIDTNSPLEIDIRSKIETANENPEIEQWKTIRTQISDQIAKYSVVEAKEAELARVSKNIADDTANLINVQETIQGFTNAEKAVNYALTEIKNCDVEKEQCEQAYQTAQTHVSSLNNLNTDITDLKKEEGILSGLQETASQLLTEYSAKNAKYTDLYDLFLREQAGILAQTLETGKPCPVCGSTGHPVPAKTSGSTPTKQALDKSKKGAETAQKECEKASRTSGDQRAKCEGLEESLRKNAKNILDKVYTREELEADLPELINTAVLNEADSDAKFKELQKTCDRKKELEEKLPQIVKNREEEERKEGEIEERKKGLEIWHGGLDGEIKTLRRDLLYSSKDEAERELKTINANIKTHDKQIKEWETEADQLKSATDQARGIVKNRSQQMEGLIKTEKSTRETFENALREKGFSDKDAYHSACRDDTILSALEKNVSDYTSSYTTADTRLKQLKDQTKDKVLVDIQELQTWIDTLGKRKDDVDTKKNIHHFRAQGNSNIREKIITDHTAWNHVVNTYSMLKNLSDTANGSLNEKEKLTFERYIQMVYFDQVLHMANQRLKIMSDGRYELIRSDGGLKHKSQTGLELDVMDKFTGIPRPVTTLSGGESFQASLSLALGLSDIIQGQNGGVQLDTIFVDEGFGSLDPEALEISLRVLKDLTAGNRLVGVISHVDALKGYIDAKIEIIKKPGGYSTLRIET